MQSLKERSRNLKRDELVRLRGLKTRVDKLEDKLAVIDNIVYENYKAYNFLEKLEEKKAIENNINERALEYKKINKQFLEKLEKLKDLNEIEKSVLIKRYSESKRWQKIADELFYSVAHVHRLHDKAIDILCK